MDVAVARSRFDEVAAACGASGSNGLRRQTEGASGYEALNSFSHMNQAAVSSYAPSLGHQRVRHFKTVRFLCLKTGASVQ